jgi:hypothetical protein
LKHGKRQTQVNKAGEKTKVIDTADLRVVLDMDNKVKTVWPKTLRAQRVWLGGGE